MNHILPKEYTETLSILQDQALRRESENELENIFIEDLGKRPDELFRKFNPVPIAAARSAQLPIFGFILYLFMAWTLIITTSRLLVASYIRK